MIGQIISHYRITEKLGEGGMGVVYKAHDARLDRTVALKFLPSHLYIGDVEKERFLQEARAAAALNHPNVCTIHDIGEHDRLPFIVMEYVDGETLRHKIRQELPSLKDSVEYAIQIAEALKVAHEKEIVHRDIKSENIMITPRGQIKVMDFGLAKLKGSVKLTKTSSTIGTLAYMAPEQIQGQEVDARSDIFSFGVVLFEMVTGQMPFGGEYDSAMMYAILNEEPQSPVAIRPDVPEKLSDVISKALEKDPDLRYQVVKGLLADLKRLKRDSGRVQRTAAVEVPQPGEEIASTKVVSEEKPEPSIAVLSFTNMSADPEQEYFCDGMAEEIINALTKVSGLRVAARTSAFYFKGKDVAIEEIGLKLHVETVLEGSVRKAGNRLRITAQLIKVVDGFHLWSERYDRVLEDVFEIQDEIAQAIVEKLEVMLGAAEKGPLVKPPTDNLEAYDLYLKGRYSYEHQYEPRRALSFYEQSLELDPRFALAHAGLAVSYLVIGTFGLVRPREVMPKAKAALERALELDDTLAFCHSVSGMTNMYYDWDWANAERHFLRALELEPRNAMAHARYSQFLAYVDGRFDEAVKAARRGIELDPMNPNMHWILGFVFEAARQYEEAIAAANKTLELSPNNIMGYHRLGVSYHYCRMYKEAINAHKSMMALAGRHPWSVALLGIAYWELGRKEEAEGLFEELFERSRKEYVQSTFLALIRSFQGRMDEAFELLERAYEERDGLLFLLRYSPAFDTLSGDARFDAFLEKMGFNK